MAGLDNILNTILSEAKESSEQIAADYQAKASEIKASAEKEKEQILSKAQSQADVDKKNAISRATSSAQLKKRQMILKAKQEIINALIEKTYASILEMDDQAYFKMLEKMMDKYMENGKDGVIYFAKKDVDRMPAGFSANVTEIAAKKNSKMTIADEAKALDGGFILVYGGIEENCSIRAIMNAEKEQIADQVNQLLFS